MPWIILLGLVYFPTAFMWVSHEPWCLGLCATAAEKTAAGCEFGWCGLWEGIAQRFLKIQKIPKG